MTFYACRQNEAARRSAEALIRTGGMPPSHLPPGSDCGLDAGSLDFSSSFTHASGGGIGGIGCGFCGVGGGFGGGFGGVGGGSAAAAAGGGVRGGASRDLGAQDPDYQPPVNR